MHLKICRAKINVPIRLILFKNFPCQGITATPIVLIFGYITLKSNLYSMSMTLPTKQKFFR